MKINAVIPVLKFISLNRRYFSLERLALTLGINQHEFQTWVCYAEIDRFFSIDIPDAEFLAIKQLGTDLGILHSGTDFEIVPLQGLVNVSGGLDAGQVDVMKMAERSVVESISRELKPFIKFEQYGPFHSLGDWKLNGKLLLLKQK
jgi:hypothetical protein